MVASASAYRERAIAFSSEDAFVFDGKFRFHCAAVYEFFKVAAFARRQTPRQVRWRVFTEATVITETLLGGHYWKSFIGNLITFPQKHKVTLCTVDMPPDERVMKVTNEGR